MLRPRMGKGMVGNVRAGGRTGQAERAGSPITTPPGSPSWGPATPPGVPAHTHPPLRLAGLASPGASSS